ncbi:MAG: hypothetical protein IJM55_10575 [Ruminococcus sp.]|nr:hypothetical protein [Ruminococcus sp.]
MNDLINNTDFWITVSAVLAAAAANSCISKGMKNDKHSQKGGHDKDD